MVVNGIDLGVEQSQEVLDKLSNSVITSGEAKEFVLSIIDNPNSDLSYRIYGRAPKTEPMVLSNCEVEIKEVIEDIDVEADNFEKMYNNKYIWNDVMLSIQSDMDNDIHDKRIGYDFKTITIKE